MSDLFKSYGVDVGHEVMGNDGITCCFYGSLHEVPDFAKKGLLNKVRSDWTFKYVINNIRDPFTAIPSIYFTDTPGDHNKNHWAHNYMRLSQEFRVKILGLNESNIYNLVALSYLGWNELIQKNGYDFRIKIEDTKEFEYFLISQGYSKVREVNVNYNSRKKDDKIDYGKFDWSKIDKEIIYKLDEFCLTNGYEELNKRINQ